MKKEPAKLSVVIALTFFLSHVGLCNAAMPHTINYQGYLTDSSGSPITGTKNMIFTVYDAPAAGNQLWSETLPVNVAGGVYSVTLGTLAPINQSIFSTQVWLGVTVQGDVELIPRYSLSNVGQALRAQIAEAALDADTVDGQHAADISATAIPSGAVMFFNLDSCPAGWIEQAAARGRTLVGLNHVGTLQGTVGSPLFNLQNRAHSHNHNHGIEPSYASTHIHTSSYVSDYSHTHAWSSFTGSTYAIWSSYNQDGSSVEMIDWSDGMDTAGSGHYPIGLSPTTASGRQYFTSNKTHDHDISASGSHTHNVDLPYITSSGAFTSDVMPYVQFLVCQKD